MPLHKKTIHRKLRRRLLSSSDEDGENNDYHDDDTKPTVNTKALVPFSKYKEQLNDDTSSDDLDNDTDDEKRETEKRNKKMLVKRENKVEHYIKDEQKSKNNYILGGRILQTLNVDSVKKKQKQNRKEMDLNIRNYLDNLFNIIFICAYANKKMTDCISYVVGHILKYNNIEFQSIKLFETEELLYEPISYFLQNCDKNSGMELVLIYNLSLVQDFCFRCYEFPIINTVDEINLEQFNPHDIHPLYKNMQLENSMINLAVMSDHVAQHIINDICRQQHKDEMPPSIPYHEHYTKYGITLHSMFSIQINKTTGQNNKQHNGTLNHETHYHFLHDYQLLQPNRKNAAFPTQQPNSAFQNDFLRHQMLLKYKEQQQPQSNVFQNLPPSQFLSSPHPLDNFPFQRE